MENKEIGATTTGAAARAFDGNCKHDASDGPIARGLRKLAVRWNLASDTVLLRHRTDLLDDEFEAFSAARELARHYREGDSDVRDIARQGLLKALTKPRAARTAMVALFDDRTQAAIDALEATLGDPAYLSEWVLAMEEIDTVNQPQRARRAEKILERTHAEGDQEDKRISATFLRQLRANERMKLDAFPIFELTIGGMPPG